MISMRGFVDFLTLCNLGILFNSLDIRSYQLSIPDGKNDTEVLRNARFREYDFNAIPFIDRGRNVYARGLSLELLRWVHTHFELKPINHDGSVKNPRQFYFTYIIEQALCILQYKELWDKEQEEGREEALEESRFTEEALRKQITWAMLTIPEIKAPWNEAICSGKTVTFMRSSEEHLFQPCYRPEQIFKPKGALYSLHDIFAIIHANIFLKH